MGILWKSSPLWEEADMERTLTKEEIYRALAARHGEELQRKIAGSTVAVCGLGGLGSHLALCLARMGIGKLILIDFDRVDLANLHRQQYKASQIGMYKTEALAENLQEIAPFGEVIPSTKRITAENIDTLLEGADVICEAFDRAEEKAALVNGVFERLPGRPVVAASGMAGFGSSNEICTRQITGKLVLCGDETSEVSADSCLFASKVMLCAAHQAHAVLRILAGENAV